jgi:hypothetical protein
MFFTYLETCMYTMLSTMFSISPFVGNPSLERCARPCSTCRAEKRLFSKPYWYSTRAQTSLTHPGRNHTVSLLDPFTHTGPDASHICIVIEPLGENPLASTISRPPSDRVHDATASSSEKRYSSVMTRLSGPGFGLWMYRRAPVFA